MKLVIASNNAHKIREFKEIFAKHEVVGPTELGLAFEHDETETSFAMNAVGKARTLWLQIQAAGSLAGEFWVLADDSGLAVDALGGAPGVYSARYGGNLPTPPRDDGERNQLLLKEMAGVADRKAHYVCCMALYRGPDRFDCVQESWHGLIAHGPSAGTGGFGYDPLFFLPEYGCTVADLAPGVKSRISHRALASVRLLALADA